MRTTTSGFILGCVLALTDAPRVLAQTATSPPADIASPVVNADQASQAPDEVLKRLSDLIHAGKYSEAQQLTTGLLLAYPDDQRLVKAKALLDKLLTSQPATATVSTSPPPTTAEQLTGMDKVDYDALVELARQAQQDTDLEHQKTSLKQFMNDSKQFLRKHPDEMLLWNLRAASAISLNDPRSGFEAGQMMLAADSNDPTARRLLAQLKNKGWLDEESVNQAQSQIEADRAQAEHDEYTFEAWRPHGMHMAVGRLTIGEKDVVYEGADGTIRFSRSDILEIRFRWIKNVGLLFKLSGGKGDLFFACSDMRAADFDTMEPLKCGFIERAIQERWKFVMAEDNKALRPPS